MTNVQQLLAIVDRGYDRRSWHGTNLRGSIRGLSADEAAWRPAPGRHNIWELVVHAAYWKYVVWRRVTNGPRGSFPLEGSNWFKRPTEPTTRAWRADVALLDRIHQELRRAIASQRPAGLTRRTRGSSETNFSVIAGVAAHDLYHAGQIQLLKKLQQHR